MTRILDVKTSGIGVMQVDTRLTIVPHVLMDEEYVLYFILGNQPPAQQVGKNTFRWNLTELQSDAISQLVKVYGNNGNTDEINEVFKIAYQDGPDSQSLTDKAYVLLSYMRQIAKGVY